MRLRFHLVSSLIVSTTVVAFLFAYFQVRSETRASRNELARRAEVLAESLKDNVEATLESREKLQRIVERYGNRENLEGIAVYDEEGDPRVMTTGLKGKLSGWTLPPPAGLHRGQTHAAFFQTGQKTTHVSILPLTRGNDLIGALAIFHDATYIEEQRAKRWRDTLIRSLALAIVITLTTLLMVRSVVTRPVARTAEWIRNLRMGRASGSSGLPDGDLFQPLNKEVAHLAGSLLAARAAAEEEARLREAAEAQWTSERLRVHVQTRLEGGRLFVVANREPYMHVRKGKSVEPVVPASGLVTALEPILRACDGTWIAHGSGDADRETVDSRDRLRVPPAEPEYTLRRVWLSREEEEGYYYGFANEGLWPLCHIAYTRPLFRTEDWEYYREVNRKFAKATLEEMADTPQAMVLVQDYHFALVPQMIKEERPDARVAIFWHIPWPNAEAFSVCPQQRALLDGLLAADLVGFHIQAHCTNFLESVDRTIESRIEWERFAVNRRGHFTMVRPFPISVNIPEPRPEGSPDPSPQVRRAALFKELGVEATLLGVGVDRIDYTKGILERFHGIERLLEKYPRYQGRFTFVQIGAPSRTHIKRYHDLQGEAEAEAERINWRFQNARWRPIVFLNRRHDHREIEPYYRAADFCLVTSLHDGMNLVAKEFVASRDDERGMLILSRFTGAARELRDAVVVNPYDMEELAEAMRFALEMDPEQQQARMQSMRRVIRENNVYRWAANLITELSQIRPESGREMVA